ncbi:MAG: precorrin-4 C(11)-methyltransferase [Candidatus Desantisbacteria bacterium]
MAEKGKVYFIGAGPGDLELLTIKGKRLVEAADVIIYTDSLVNPDIERMAREGARIHRSSTLTLEEIVNIMVEAVEQGKMVARLHTGDPALFSAVHEQRALLEQKDIDYTIVPGVSSVFAAAATLKAELTLPGICQTVIITRLEGRTPMPPKEKIESLAQHQATLVLFLSTPQLSVVVKQLIEGGYPPETPVAIVARASWPDEKIIRGTLGNIESHVNAEEIDNPSIVLVGKALSPSLSKSEGVPRSRLYDASFSHGRRPAKR